MSFIKRFKSIFEKAICILTLLSPLNFQAGAGCSSQAKQELKNDIALPQYDQHAQYFPIQNSYQEPEREQLAIIQQAIVNSNSSSSGIPTPHQPFDSYYDESLLPTSHAHQESQFLLTPSHHAFGHSNTAFARRYQKEWDEIRRIKEITETIAIFQNTQAKLLKPHKPIYKLQDNSSQAATCRSSESNDEHYPAPLTNPSCSKPNSPTHEIETHETEYSSLFSPLKSPLNRFTLEEASRENLSGTPSQRVLSPKELVCDWFMNNNQPSSTITMGKTTDFKSLTSGCSSDEDPPMFKKTNQ